MYEFIRLQYQMGVIDAGTVATFVPRWITAEQMETIINGSGK